MVLTSLGWLSAARGQDEDRHHPPRESQDDTRRPIAVTINPLGLAVERYGGNVEASPLPHHVFTGTLYTQAVPTWLVKSISGRSEGVHDGGGSSLGGELGYRLYSGSIGADGLFAGGSFVTMPLAYPRVDADLRSADLVRFNALGAAFDIGVQKVTSSGFTIGGGVGVMYLAYEMPQDVRRIPIGLEPHVLPRLLLAAGWSF
ncbi:MAG: hypothetical protein NVS3B10_05580 [Polyangiales bacterium]